MAMEFSEKKLQLHILSPDDGVEPFECDAVMLTVADGSKGNEGGLYSVHPGHVNAVLLLAGGEVTASKASNVIFRAKTGEGLARISRGEVKVTVSGFTLITE